MRNDFNISVKKPCSEKFGNFMATENGGYCDTCKKDVIDFTEMDQKELVLFFKDTNTKTCGRFTASQLKTYESGIANKSMSGFLPRSIGIMGFSLLSLCTASTASAQKTALNEQTENTGQSTVATNIKPLLATKKYTVKGVVHDDQDLPLPGVNVVLKGTNVGVITDLDGKFEFSKALEVDDVLIFSYLGYETKEHKITKSNSSVLELTIAFDIADVELMGEVVIDGPYRSKRNIFQKITALFKR